VTLAIEVGKPVWARAPSDGPRGTRFRAADLARILVVEDEALVALEIQSGLESVGHEIVGVAARTGAAGTLVRATRPDLALVDIRLARGDSGLDVAADFTRLGVACMFVTGNCPLDRGMGLAVGCLHKPFDEWQLVQAVAAAMAVVRGGGAPDRLPRGFHLFARPS
jgi:CheY-like chemotaxis protein